MLLTSILAGSGHRRAPIPESLFGRHLPVPAGKVDQVPRMCMARLRKKTTANYSKDGVERFRQTFLHEGTQSDHDFIQHLIFYTEEREKDKTVDIFSWLTYTSYKKSQEILRAWEWHPVIISYTR